MELGASYRLADNGKIHVGNSQNADTAELVNAGTIENLNLTEAVAHGAFENNGTVYNTGDISVSGSGFSGTGDVYNEQNGSAAGVPDMISVARNISELQDRIGSQSEITLIDGTLPLGCDITIPDGCTVSLGKGGICHYGELITADFHAITVEAGAKLVVSEGCLEIVDSGKLVNKGTVVCEADGTIKIGSGCSLEISSDIAVYGSPDLYDRENSSSYITGDGKITVYGNRANMIEKLFQTLYDYQDRDQEDQPLAPTVITPKTGFTSYIKTGAEVKTFYSEFDTWLTNHERGDNDVRRYAYAAIKANGVLGVGANDTPNGAETLGDSKADAPYEKLTYACLKSVLQAVSALFHDSGRYSSQSYVTDLKDTDELVMETLGWKNEVFEESNNRDIR